MLNLFAAIRAVSLHGKAENAAFDCDWPRAAELVSQASEAYGEVGRRKLIPLHVRTLSAMIDYRLGRFDAVSSTVEIVLNSDRRLWRGISTADANYIRFFLFQLMEHVAGADDAVKCADHLARAEAIGVPRATLKLAKTDPYLVGLFPLVAVDKV